MRSHQEKGEPKSLHTHRRARARLGGAIDMWLALASPGVSIDQARDVAEAIGIPYVAVALLNSSPPLTRQDLDEWQRWADREDFLVALRAREV